MIQFFRKKITIIILLLCIFIVFCFCTICYSAFSSTMNISGVGFSRVEADVRITDLVINSDNNSDILSLYEQFSKNMVLIGVNADSATSKSLFYNLEITNYSSNDVGIFSINSNVEVIIHDYSLKDKICDDTGKCNSFVVVTYVIEIIFPSNNFVGDIVVEFDFRPFYSISYYGVEGNYLSEVIGGDDVTLDFSSEDVKYLYVHGTEDYSYYNKILSINNIGSELIIEVVGDVFFNYDYVKGVQEFESLYNGIYKISVWGAQGGSYNSSCVGGYGGYATGEISLNKGDKLYVYIGGRGKGSGTHTYQEGGYNGGGSATPNSDSNTRQSSGGGATHVALTARGVLSNYSSFISELIIVAGGGGGGAGNSAVMCVTSGSGGGVNGGSGGVYTEGSRTAMAFGGTQSSGGSVSGSFDSAIGSFGQGASKIYAGGGGGYYGGAVMHCSAGGGSGYIGNSQLSNKHMSCYKCDTSLSESTKTISALGYSSTPIDDYAKIGDGYASITLIKHILD